MGNVKKRVFRGLKGKLILSILAVGALPLAGGMVLSFVQGTRELQGLIGTNFSGIAQETSRKLDLLLNEELGRTLQIASDPQIMQILQEYHEQLKAQRSGQQSTPLEEMRARWKVQEHALVRQVTQGPIAKALKRYFVEQQKRQATQRSERSPTRALFLTDAQGILVASIGADVDFAHAEQAWWKAAYRGGQGGRHFGSLYFDDRLGIYAFSLSVPVMGEIGDRAVGVLHRVYDAETFLNPSVYPIRFGKTGHVMLIDGEGRVMSCPILPTGARLTDLELVRLVTRPEGGWVQAPSDGHGSRITSTIGFSPLSVTAQAARQSPTGWYTFVWQSSEELFAPTRSLFVWILGLGVVGILLLGGLGYIAATRIVRPIRRLQEGASIIGRGELREPITVQTGDEIEQLAEEFNRMNARLQEAFMGLEHQVEEKTQEVLYLQTYNEQILEYIPNPIIILDPEEQVEYMNSAARRVLILPDGYSPRARLFDLINGKSALRSKLRKEFRMYVDACVSGTNQSFSSFSSENSMEDPLTHPVSLSRDNGRKEFKISNSIYQYDWFHIRPRVEDELRIGLLLRDITQESRLQDQLVQTERLSSLEVLTAGIAHELNNPLFGIMGPGEAILDECDSSRMKEHAKKIVENAKRMAAVIQDFSGYAHAEGSEQGVFVDINHCLDKALSLVGLSNPVDGLEIKKNYKALPRCKVRPEEIIQVFIHIIKNGIQAMKGKGTLYLNTDVSYGTISVRIRDTGPGIPFNFSSRIFEPFFTTKGPGQGTGLGLTIARRIVMRYGGVIRLETEEGRGTTFILFFPILVAVSSS
ncbi:MAG: ATP-binding protein [Nitrospira sp.]|nr:ATP-binding protein [Nitrospira sp.]